MSIFPLFFVAAFVFGVCVGSFLNVCIYRIPAGLSIVRPGSHCPRCDTTIAFYDNVPIFSYLLLGGKCRNCKVPISLRYPLVELLTGLLASMCLWRFGPTFLGLTAFVFVAVLVVVTFIDVDHRIIPDVISLPGIPLFFFISLANPYLTWLESVWGIVIGGGILFTVAWGYQMMTGRDGMGGGDIKLLAMIGAMVGWKGVVFTLFAASVIGAMVGLFAMIRAGKDMRLAIPFGPFLSAGAILFLFFGNELIFWYVSVLN